MKDNFVAQKQFLIAGLLGSHNAKMLSTMGLR